MHPIKNCIVWNCNKYYSTTLIKSLLLFFLAVTLPIHFSIAQQISFNDNPGYYAKHFWQPTYGPFGGAGIKDLLNCGDQILFLATSEGIIRSLDNGRTWNRNPTLIKIFCSLAMDSLNNLYATATDEASNPYLFKSTDKGLSWTKINNNFWAGFRDILIFYKDTILVESSNRGLYRTTDGGINWIQINNGLDNLNVNKINLLSNGDLLAGTNGSGVYRSTDWGNLWTVSNTGIPIGNGGYRYAYSLLETDSGKVYCGTQAGIYYSTNYGNNWVPKTLGFGNKHASDLAVDNDRNVYASTAGVYVLQNGSSIWTYLGLNYNVTTLGWDSKSNLCAGTSSQGLYRYSFGDSSWTQIYNQGYTPLETDVIITTENENLFAGTHWEGLYRSTNHGRIWEKTSFTGLVDNLIAIDDSSIMLGAYLSRDLGNTWEQICDYDVRSVYYDTLNHNIYVGTSSLGINGICGIFKTSDFGLNWEMISSLEILGQATIIDKLLITKTNHYILINVVYADPYWGDWYSFYRSTDNGQSWETKFTTDMQDILENNNGNLYTTDNWKLHISYDEGATWSPRDIGGYLLASDNLGRIYVGGGNNSIKTSSDDGINWSVVGDYPMYVNDMAISKNNHIYAANSLGIFWGDANNLVLSVEDLSIKIHTFSLYQNYPNPFNPATNISFSIPKRTNVNIKVFNLLGGEITELVNGEFNAGVHTVKFNATSLPSGIYFYRMQAGSFNKTKKMILLK